VRRTYHIGLAGLYNTALVVVKGVGRKKSKLKIQNYKGGALTGYPLQVLAAGKGFL
jgi:hypothetical protein